MSFGRDIARYRPKATGQAEEVFRRSALELFSSIVIGTPVDKGVLRNNWWLDIGRPSGKTTRASDRSGQAAINGARSNIASAKGYAVVFFSNNLPYAERIEFDGHSGKAPAGMVRINARRWREIVARNAKVMARG